MEKSIRVELDHSPKVNFAYQQNAIPVIRNLTLVNNSECELKNINIEISANPEFCQPYTESITSLDPGKEYSFSNLDLHLDYNFLSKVSEKAKGTIAVNITTESADSDISHECSKTYEIEVLPYDIWPGVNIMPELLASFVTPNDNAVEMILGQVANFLESRLGDSAISGYQSKNKKYVYDLVHAVFDAVKQMGINYTNPAPSFEETGQKIRFPHKIQETRLATCLDLAVLMCSILEQCGLNPIILLHEGHAYAGCFLLEENFSNIIEDDLQTIRKRAELDELIVFETTMATGNKLVAFDHAVTAAKPHLQLDSKFHMAIDIKAARSANITPLPVMREGLDLSLLKTGFKKTPQIIHGVDRELKEEIIIENGEQIPQTRIDNWKRHLLDLTLRNRLLNFRETKQAVPLFCSDPDKLEDDIAGKRKFKVLPKTPQLEGKDPRNSELLQKQQLEDFLQGYLRDELKRGQLRSRLTERELSNRLVTLFRAARNDLEEGGVNTLFLSLGSLEWKDQGGQNRTAPLILLPVKLGRESVRHGFSLERYDDDAAINVTLLEMLRRDYDLTVPGMDNPPEDESGLDVLKIFQLFQQAIKDMKGWEIKKDVWLSRFSFSKFIMWNDLNERVDELMNNPIVKHLVESPEESYNDGIEGCMPQELDKNSSYEHVYCPMSADSSQLAAVVSAERGKTFVLHGPPGTGKSQTITNMIAHCLAVGKRVLFVSEKRAALEVVHKRLCSIGLEPFCLELHSNKSGKMEVLNQFKKSLAFAGYRQPEEWQTVTSRLEKLRNELNGYELELHKIYPNGFSLYKSFSQVLKSQDKYEGSGLALRLENPVETSPENFENLIELCQKLELRYQQLTSEEISELSFIKCTEWSRQWELDLLDCLSELEEKSQFFATDFQNLADFFELEMSQPSQVEVVNLLGLASILLNAKALPKDFVKSNWNEFSVNAQDIILTGQERDELQEKVSGFKDEAIKEIEIDSMIKSFEQAAQKNFFVRWIEQHKLVKILRDCQKLGVPKLPKKQALESMNNIKRFKELESQIEAFAPQAQERLGSNWNNGKPDWKEIETLIELGDKLNKHLSILAQAQDNSGVKLKTKIGSLLENASDTLGASGKLYPVITQITKSWNDYKEILAKTKDLIQHDEKNFPHESGFLNQIVDMCKAVRRFSSKLRPLTLLLQVKNSAVQNDLSPIVDALDSGKIEENIAELFQYLFHQAFIDQVMAESAVLREFIGDEHDLRVSKFKELDQKYSELSAHLVISKLAANLPGARGKQAPKGTPIGLIQRECQKKSRHLPVRKLLEKTQSILHSLKPCMLMSPLSVAQYLPTNQANFDIVIFDEASQIPVWDSIGAIARAPQCIVVGDPKQLPPTNFFGRTDSSEDEYDSASDENDIVELESILDECIAAGIDNSYLQWHYRSRHESLIAFSNHHYYENRLYTFPASVNTSVGTRFVFADGVYDKSKTRTNRKEARVLIDEVISRLTNPLCADKSIGIVTFSQAQQMLIEDMLDHARDKHPEIDKYFTDQVEEPVFVKNLENVQGDERDIIFFSICYAKDAVGKMSMNFGPLNREGGERRLNVAITRAREEVVVFSSIKDSDIDLNRTKSVGVAHLKTYLKYAAKGMNALADISDREISTDDYDSYFEQEVADFLRAKGYTVHTQIGCSGYRIDLAVVHPEEPGRYILGVECDGAAYHCSATARDRDKLRQSVLENLGWRIHRVWSTGWWHNSDYVKQKLLQAVETAIQTPVQKASKPETSSKAYAADYSEEYVPTESNFKDSEYSLEYPTLIYNKIRYNQERFYEARARNHIKQQMLEVIKTEGPVLESILRKRICEQWNFTRAGNNIREVLDKCIPHNLAKTTQNGENVFWPENLSPTEYSYFRYPGKHKESKRSIHEIPIEEIVNSMYYILTEYRGCKPNILFKESAAIFGVSRVTSKSEPYLEAALQRLMESPDVE